MKVQRTLQVERAGVARVDHLVTRELGWLFREQPIADMGIDAHLELVDDARQEATGRLLGVQIKSGLSYFRTPTGDGWWFACDADHVSYWLGHSLPVLVFLYNPDTEHVYWQHVNEQTVVRTGKMAKIHVPRSHELTAKSAATLRPLARSSSEVPAMAAWLTSLIEHPQQDAFYTHLLSARLHAMFPGVRIQSHHFDEHPEMTIRFRSSSRDWRDRKIVDVAVAERISDAVRLAAKFGSPKRSAPLVIVIRSSLRHEDVAGLSNMPERLAVFAAPWTTDGRYDTHLKAAMDRALGWIESWSTEE
ncbi:DUF4365 domain-containing protein [Streptomyces sp. SID8111]|uniref:DUF4365 domain-containing protein n=1 Tax=Streptomyces sp. SID8111 TaxID=2706100 RepID=UPI0031BAFAD8